MRVQAVWCIFATAVESELKCPSNQCTAESDSLSVQFGCVSREYQACACDL